MAWEIPGAVSLFLFFIVALWEYYRWKKNKKDTKDIERLKAEYAKRQTIHRVQFETEFNIYKDLWRNMVKISEAITLLDAYISKSKDNPEEKQFCVEKIDETKDWIMEAHSFYFLNKPFYSKPIYILCEELIAHCFKQLEYLTNQFKKQERTDKLGMVLLSNVIGPIMTKIDEAIQKQIGFIKKAEIVQ